MSTVILELARSHLSDEFEVETLVFPYVFVTRKEDGVKGSVLWDWRAGTFSRFIPKDTRKRGIH